MKFTTDFKLENFILNTKWDDFSEEVKERAKGCFVDLLGALISGSGSRQFEVGLRFAESVYGKGDIPVIGAGKKFGFMGASAAMGHSSNAYDIDDGHNIIRAHPGTSFIGALIASGYDKNISFTEFLTSMVVAYETTIRSGAAIMDYYKYAHSSGTFGAVGVAAGVGRIYGFSKEELNNVLSVAEFNAPLVPGIRSVEYPSMNKDGVPFGVMIGAMAIMENLCGFEGNKNLLEADEYNHYIDDIGKNYEIMNLYFKPYPCCRWAHPAIDACIGTMNKYNISYKEIDKVVIKTFKRATLLSKIVPKSADEAQYNIAYPVATSVVYGDFGINHVQEESFSDSSILEMMNKLSFETDENIDKQFPGKRICRAEIYTTEGNVYISDECEPRGEAYENISFEWLTDKFKRITAPFLSSEKQTKITEWIKKSETGSLREIIDMVNEELGIVYE